jgi:uncharacterized protein YjbI with pentapeptide repeats
LANTKQLSILGEGLEVWNSWRIEHPRELIDLSGADLRNLEFGLLPALRRADAQGLIPQGSSWPFIYNEIVGYDVMPLNLRAADLRRANLDGADLIKAECQGADFSDATLRAANLHRADLSSARFIGTDLSRADLRGADLSASVFVRTNVEGTDLGYSDVYGISVWSITGTPADETGLRVTPFEEPYVRTDSLALAQLIYFLIREEHARDLIDTVTSRLVLVLGNFREDRKAVLEAVRSALKDLGFMPLIFDFEGPSAKDTTGTVETLARLARFVVADLTDPSSVPHELATTVPFLRTTPVLLFRKSGATGYSMARDLEAYPWVLGVHQYETSDLLVARLPDLVRQARALADTLHGKASE